ncbi:Molecular chaperones HSP70 [Klebsormidium nitens]|uniref:Molecular chaperones HSP70 n=1 Tax=Klebsormidium nitens TaxID=105231 RepID=A0A1Y1HNX0_KLENI|nr:Molecular chaperones HSP70 [Klebsormidium nitens]|eukprot:GAQ79452.1 Molecular chaperones HSP70 [Klebsormidium nitens]
MDITAEESKYVIGLDFGTTFSGIAVAARSSKDKIFIKEDWEAQTELVGGSYCKTITASLYHNGKLEGWGWPALLKYNKAVEGAIINQAKSGTHDPNKDVDLGGMELLERFKLLLAPEGTAKTALVLPKGLTKEKVVADYLACVAEAGLTLLRKNFGDFIQPEHVQWCLTVPAIWTNAAKVVMQKCAEQAGLLKTKTNPKGSPFPLIIVLEPEAASLYCQRNLEKELSLQDNEPYMVVDAGGGTVDLVVHEKRGEGLGELEMGSGGTCGGSYVDDNFFKFMAAKYPFFGKWAGIHKTGLDELKRDWHTQKKLFKGSDESILVRVPHSFLDMARDEGVKEAFSKGSITVSGAEVAAIFEPVVEDILQLVRDQLAKQPGCKTLLLVGGFAESDYLHDRIKAEFKAKIPVIVRPAQPGSAIIQGAVIFGFDPRRAILNRRSRKTYGIEIAEEFVESRHDASKKFYEGSRAYCRNRFLKFVTVNQDISVDEVVEHIVLPLSSTQSAVSITLYSTDQTDPEYVTDAGLHKESSIVMDLSQSSLGKKSQIVVSLSFGSTSIEVKAKGGNFAAEDVKCEVTGHFEMH